MEPPPHLRPGQDQQEDRMTNHRWAQTTIFASAIALALLPGMVTAETTPALTGADHSTAAAYFVAARNTAAAEDALADIALAGANAEAALLDAQVALEVASNGLLDLTEPQARGDAAEAVVLAADRAQAAAQQDLDAAMQVERDALLAASGGQELSEAALAEYRATLGL
jgi:hypothetical protein